MPKNHSVKVRLSKEEHSKIQHKASRLGMTISSYLRLLGLASDIKTTNGE